MRERGKEGRKSGGSKDDTGGGKKGEGRGEGKKHRKVEGGKEERENMNYENGLEWKAGDKEGRNVGGQEGGKEKWVEVKDNNWRLGSSRKPSA